MVLRAAPLESCEQPAVAQVPTGFAYDRRRPHGHTEMQALHKAVRIGWPQLQERIADQTAAALPKFVVKGFEAYLTCGQLAAGFCRVLCRGCREEQFVAWSCKRRGLCASCDGNACWKKVNTC